MTTTLAICALVGIMATILVMDCENLKGHDYKQSEREERMREWVSR